MTIPLLILSALSAADGDRDELRRVKEVCDRYESRMAPNADLGPVHCDCINAVYCAWTAYAERLAGNIQSALRYERTLHRLLRKNGV